MRTPGATNPVLSSTELQFPETAAEYPANTTRERYEALSRQAYILEFAANSVLATFSPPEVGSDLWIAHLALHLDEFHRGLIPESHIEVADTRIMMAQEFNSRLELGVVSKVDHSRILTGLITYEDPVITNSIEDILSGFDTGTDPRDLPGYLSSGNNAAAFILRNIAGIDGDAVLKIGFPIVDELSKCDRSAITNLRRWLGLMASKGVDSFEQPVAVSVENPFCITKLVPGLELYEISKLKNKPLPSEEAQLEFANALYEAIVRRITIDINGRDILFDPETDALTIIDHAAPSRAYNRIATNYSESIDQFVAIFKAAFGFQFDEIKFERLLEEFSIQGLHDLRAQL